MTTKLLAVMLGAALAAPRSAPDARGACEETHAGALPAGSVVAFISTPNAQRNGYVATYAIDPLTGCLALADRTPISEPGGIAVDRSGRFAYVGDTPLEPNGRTQVDVHGYRIEKGLLEPLGRFATRDRLNQVAGEIVASDGHVFLLTGARSSGSRNRSFVYRIDGGGALTPIGPFTSLIDPYRLALTPSGRLLYVAGQTFVSASGYALEAHLIRQGQWSGPIGVAPATSLGPVAMDPYGRFLWSGSTVFAIDVTTGQAGLAARFAGAPVLVAHPSGRWLLGFDAREAITYEIDRDTGVPRRALAVAHEGFTPTLAVAHPSAPFVYVAGNRLSGRLREVFGFRVDPRTGAVTPLGRVAEGGQGLALATVR